MIHSMRYIALFFLVILIGCSKPEEPILRLATTTSVNDTGLLDLLSTVLLKEKGNIELQWVSVGTGKALELGKNCDVDLVLTHMPTAEEKAIASGGLKERTPIMYNYFVLVGPSSLKEKVEGTSVSEVLQDVSKNQYPFISRGDASGTHQKEIELWQAINIPKEELTTPWYMETGQGMLQTLVVADEKEGFTLTDIATWAKFQDAYPNSRLVAYVDNDESLKNIYSTLFVDKERCPKVKDELAREFVSWLTSKSTQEFIGAYRLQYKNVFFPLYIEEMPKE
ncbi:MAG: substrate-binding domain-containing protein [Desulfovibrionaceae bacterium]|nr:substrate-binding domain-containing protein [Desulfovibrionaceae bacterium]